MKGSTFKRCGCTDPLTGRRLDRHCPKLRGSKHGTWFYVAEMPAGPDGQRRQQRRGGFASEREAREALDKLRSRLGAGQEVNDQLSTAQWLDAWISGKRTLRATTRRSYAQHLDLYLRPHLGSVPLEKLRAAHISTMFDAIAAGNGDRERPVGPATMQRIRATLRSSLNAAVRQQRITVNPALHVELESGARPRAVVWTPERVAEWRHTGKRPSAVMVWTVQQLGAFLDQAADDPLYALYHLIAFRGLRRGEAVGLPWCDVDLDGGTLTVSQQVVQLGWRTEVGRPKTDSGARVVALDAETVTVLRAHRRQQLERRLVWGEAWTDSGFVFTREDGAALHPDFASRHFGRLVHRADLPPIRLHDLRHGAATIALAGGVDLKVVQAMLGHSSLTLTADTYTSVLPEVARSAAEAAARMVPRAARVPGRNLP